MRVVVVMPQGPREAYAAVEQAGHELVLGEGESSRGARPTDDSIIPLAEGAHCLIYNEGSRRLMEALPELRACIATGLGYDKIDVAAANELGIVVCNTPTPLQSIGVAEGTFTLMLAVAKRLTQKTDALRAGRWASDADDGTLIQGSTVGLVGLGRIGTSFARMLTGWNARLLVHTRTPKPDVFAEVRAEPVDLPKLLHESDFVVLTVPLTPETNGMIGRDELRSMKPTAAIVNTSRGQVIDEAALCEAINKGWIAGAGIDVFSKEPLPMDSPLLALDSDRVLLTAHNVSSAETSRKARMDTLMNTVLTAMDGRVPDLAVNPEVAATWRGRRPA
jgi:phosphoglycerate dehydrogenase-like enzyme